MTLKEIFPNSWEQGKEVRRLYWDANNLFPDGKFMDDLNRADRIASDWYIVREF